MKLDAVKSTSNQTSVLTTTHLLDLHFMIMHPRGVHLSMAILRFLYPPLDVNNGLSVQALCPANHVLRDFALFLSEDTLQRRELRAEDEEDNLGPCSVVPVE